MFLSKKVLGVCPARSGSKGIKLKNLRKVNGKSLIAITGEFSRKSNMIDASVITSDSKKMLDEGIKWGFDYGLLRPQHLSTDSASSLDTWIHAWIEYEKISKLRFDYSILLQPTSPMRTEEELLSIFREFEINNYEIITTLSEVPGHYKPEKIICETENNLDFYCQNIPHNDRNTLPHYFYRNGNFYLASREQILHKKILLEGKYGFHISKNFSVNIDDEIDLLIADKLIKREKLCE